MRVAGSLNDLALLSRAQRFGGGRWLYQKDLWSWGTGGGRVVRGRKMNETRFKNETAGNYKSKHDVTLLCFSMRPHPTDMDVSVKILNK